MDKYSYIYWRFCTISGSYKQISDILARELMKGQKVRFSSFH